MTTATLQLSKNDFSTKSKGVRRFVAHLFPVVVIRNTQNQRDSRDFSLEKDAPEVANIALNHQPKTR